MGHVFVWLLRRTPNNWVQSDRTEEKQEKGRGDRPVCQKLRLFPALPQLSILYPSETSQRVDEVPLAAAPVLMQKISLRRDDHIVAWRKQPSISAE
jgi:hypothetical protein